MERCNKCGEYYERCNKCGEYYYCDSHKCSPQYKIYHENEDSEYDKIKDEYFRTVYAHDHGQAAKKYAEWEDKRSAEYMIARFREIILIIEDESGKREKWRVTGHAEPVYDAYKMEGKNENNNERD